MKEIVLLPKDRIGVVKSKNTKEDIEKKLKVKLSFVENSVEIDGEGLELYTAKNIIKAVGRGFSPPRAFRLLEEDNILEIIELGNFSESKMKSIKSRVIGAGGKTRNIIEHDTKCLASVYGKTISLIGTYEQVSLAKEAISMIIDGSTHSSVYKFLNRKKI